MNDRMWAIARWAVAIILVSQASLLQAKVEQRPVYICGYAINFADSTAYLTAIQCIDTAYVESRNGFLMDRNQYSAQLNHYMRKLSGGNNYTCMVLFDKKQARLQKRVEQMRRRSGKASAMRLKTLGAAEFQFIGEQYVDTSVTMLDEDTEGTEAPAAPASHEAPQAKGGKPSKARKGGRH